MSEISKIESTEPNDLEEMNPKSMEDFNKLFEDDFKTDEEIEIGEEYDNYLKLREAYEELAGEESEETESEQTETRELTDEEVKMLQEKLGWSEEKIRQHCTIDEDDVIHYKTDREDMEGQTSECGVKYERKQFEYNGVVIEGVFPVFDSVFDTELAEEDYKSSSTKQFSESNKKLKEAVENDPELRKQLTEEQLEDIEKGRTPRGYTWHHNEEPGKMQLVKTEDHDRRIGGAAHTGGNSIWGNKSTETAGSNSAKGEVF